jgi:hypothetical protein
MIQENLAWLRVSGVLAVALVTGCGSRGAGADSLDVGMDDSGGQFVGDDATTAGALGAYVEQNRIKVTFVTVSCSGTCPTVEAVGTGGKPPYTFAWSDGLKTSTREVCPASTTRYQVTVTDTATTGEFATSAASAQASLTADVLACPDGGAGSADAGPSGELCLSDPSLEGTAAATIEQIDAGPWTSCLLGLAYANIWNASEADGIAPSDGNTYLRLGSVGDQSRVSSASEALCAPMRAGTAYSMTMDMAYESEDSTSPSSLQIWGGTSSCALGELLWSSPPVTSTTWKTYCATLTPTQDTPYLTLAAAVPSSLLGNTSGLYVDHLLPVAACP